MGPEFVTVAAGGMEWSAFEKVQVEAGYKHAVRSFSLTVAAEIGPGATAAAFLPGILVTILFNGDLAFTGYVDRYQPSIDEHSRAQAVISGRSKSQDIVDSAAMHDTGRFENKTVAEIGQALDKFGVGVHSDQQLEKIPFYQVTPGETVFRALEKLARSQGLTMTAPPDGSLLITSGSSQRQSGGLIEGQNIKKAEADFNWSGRHSHAEARGQRPVGTGSDNLQVVGKAQDGSVSRYRPVVIHIDDDTDTKRAKKRAKHQLAREAGHALKASVTVQGFRDDGGMLWTPGATVWLESPFLNIAQDMLIEKVSYEQDRSAGSLTKLDLCDPQAYAASSGGGGSAGGAWGSSAEEE